MPTIWFRLLALTAMLAARAALTCSAHADDEVVRTVYWDHAQFTRGEPFEVECERGSYLVGFDGQAGAWIDHLRIVCARWNVVRGELEPPVVLKERQVGWSQGGEPTHAECPIGTGIAGSYDEHYSRNDGAYVLHTLEFNCEGATDGMRPRWREFGSTSPIATGWKDPQPHAGCQAGYLATGMYGRSGEFIDKLFGWVCRRRPAESPFAGAKVIGAAKAKAYDRKSAVSGPSRIGKGLITGSGDAAPSSPPPPPSPPVEKAETTNDTDVYRRVVKNNNVIFERFDLDEAHFLPRGFVAPVIAKEGGWWKLNLANVDFVNGEGWVAADQLKPSP